MAFGFPYFDEEDPQIGEVHVLSSSNPNDDLIVQGEQPNDGFGFRVQGIAVPFWNQYHDLLVSAPNWNDGTGAVGRVYLIEGDTGNFLHTFQGDEVDSFFGFAFAAIGDVTGNWIRDIAIGAPSAGTKNEGRVYIFNGATGQLVDTIDGPVPGGGFGASIAGVGDVNGDGFPDLIIGAPATHDGPHNIGRAYVYDGATRELICTIEGEPYHGRLGVAVAGGRDITGDSVRDIIVSAPNMTNATITVPPHGPGMATIHSYGRVYVFSATSIAAHGAATPLSASAADLVLSPSIEGDIDYGYHLEIGNDVTQDGIENLIVSSRYETEDASLLLEGMDKAIRANVLKGSDGSVVQTYTVGEDVEETVEYADTGGRPPCPPHCPVCPPTYQTCEQVYTQCPQACNCVRNATQAFLIRQRSNRRWHWAVIVGQNVVCGLTLVGGPVTTALGCGAATMGALAIVVGLETSSRNQLSNDWIACFTNAGCTAPQFPYW